MSDAPPITIYTTSQIMTFFKLEELARKMDVHVVGHPIKHLLDLFMLEGGERDIIIIPFISQYESLVDKFRKKMCHGPVLFVADIPLSASDLHTILKKSAIHINIKRERISYIVSLVEYLITALQTKETSQAVEDLSLYMGLANQMQENYLRESDRGGGQGDADEPAEPEPQMLLPDPVSLFDLMDMEAFEKAVFTFSFHVLSKDRQVKHTVCFMARLSHSGILEYPRKTLILYFYEFHPDTVKGPLMKIAEKISPETLEYCLESEENINELEQTVQLSFSMDGVQRNCRIAPQFEDDDRIGFVVLSDAYFQKRRYIRVIPTQEMPMTVLVSSRNHSTNIVSVVDVSEAGISFKSTVKCPKDSSLNLYLRWQDHDTREIVCKGKVRFCGQSDKPDQFKIGVELFIHEKEQAMLRKYVFDCQSNVFETLREEGLI